MTIPISEQIAEVKRELALRERVYPSFIARGKMDQPEADKHMERMTAALHTLLWVEKNATVIRAAVPPARTATDPEETTDG